MATLDPVRRSTAELESGQTLSNVSIFKPETTETVLSMHEYIPWSIHLP